MTSGIKVEDVDYKTYDRKIKLKNTVKIKPNQTKYVRYYVVGNTTWPNYSDYTLFYKFRYDGKTYNARTWDSESIFKRNGEWYYTYWDDDWYEDWY